jgi:hypothetical protein
MNQIANHNQFMKYQQEQLFISDAESTLINDQYDLLLAMDIVRSLVFKTKPKNRWIQHLKQYKIAHPTATHRQALTHAKTWNNWVSKGRTPRVKVIKVPKQPRVHACSSCKFSTTFKSNFNRHMKKHADKASVVKNLVIARGTIRSLEGVVKTAKIDNGKNKFSSSDRFISEAQHIENKQKLEEAYLLRDQSSKLLKLIYDGTIKQHILTTQEKQTKRANTLFNENKIENMNKFYGLVSENELGFGMKNIKNITLDENAKIIIEVIDFVLGGKQVKTLIVTPTDDGWEAKFQAHLMFNDRKIVVNAAKFQFRA